MKARYDTEADALSIDLVEVEHWEHGEQLGDYCCVAIADGAPVNVEILSPEKHTDLIEQVAVRYELDVAGLRAAAHSALAAPDRDVELTVA